VIMAAFETAFGNIRACGIDESQALRFRDAAIRLKPLLGAFPATPFLHDTTTKNVIVTEHGAFSGIVDVDDLCFGDPRQTKALTMASLLASGSPTDYVYDWLWRAGEEADAPFWLYTSLSLLSFMGEHLMSANGNASAPPNAYVRHVSDMLSTCLKRAEKA
jgi:hypothetical protein